VLNLGGVGNVTWIGPGDDEILAFDTGPANALIDDWVRSQTGQTADLEGALARAGQVSAEHVTRFLAHPYFERRPPKSLDRDDFQAAIPHGLSLADGAATLTEMTAASVAASTRHFPSPPREWLVCGGGRHNPAIMAALARHLGVPVRPVSPHPDSPPLAEEGREGAGQVQVRPVEAVGWNGDALEAQAFAYLAVRSVLGLPLSLPSTTGAPHPVRGGRLFPAAG
jgi:anhydro-N-acetylmuramic acid kinase